MRVEENKILAPLTTFEIGGPARWFVEATSEAEIEEATAWVRERRLKLLVLGGGSNLLVADRGFDGLVLKIGLRGVKFEDRGKLRIYRAAAGQDWSDFAEETAAAGCAGLECLAGIPGTVGGTPVQNVGAYGQEVGNSIERVRAFDLDEQEFVEFTAAECGFAYRRSRFNTVDRGRYVVTRVDFRVTPGGRATVGYYDLERILGSHTAETSPAKAASMVKTVRQTKGMLLVAGDVDCRSAGSFFKNPLVSAEQAARIAENAKTKPPQYPVEDSELIKIPAAWLIEHAGFRKGYARGRAAISSKHTLALVNLGGATAVEVLALAAEIVSTVEACFGVRLEIEPVRAGF
jgi:UDP-N-acetylmuramate dehydrogenase